jgi:hypothetical protein
MALRMPGRWPGCGRCGRWAAHLRLARQIPEDDNLLLTGRGEARAVGAEGDSADHARVTGKVNEELAAVPDADGAIVVACRDSSGVALERQSTHPDDWGTAS